MQSVVSSYKIHLNVSVLIGHNHIWALSFAFYRPSVMTSHISKVKAAVFRFKRRTSARS